MNQFGFIGMGNMAQALAAGFVRAGALKAEQILAYAPNQDKLLKNSKKIGFTPVGTVEELVQKADTIVVACKPYQIEGVLAEVGELMAGKAVISVAAGWDFAKYQALIPDSRIQFVMPNTPAMVSEGVFLFEATHSLTDEEHEQTLNLFKSLGVVIELPTNLMGIGGAVSGCGPAFVDLFMEAYADAAVKYGIPRATAYQMVAQTVLGSAKLQLETGEHPGVLKDNVCSPGGTTIRGVAKLEEKGLRDACISSIDAIMNKKN